MSIERAIGFVLGEPAKTTLQAEKKPPEQLSRREREIAELVAQGMSNKQIASSLVISQRTAEAHVEHILMKLGYTSRAQIAAWVTEQRASR